MDREEFLKTFGAFLVSAGLAGCGSSGSDEAEETGGEGLRIWATRPPRILSSSTASGNPT